MFGLSTPVDENIVNHAYNTFQIGKNVRHSPLEVLGRRSDPERQSSETESAEGSYESCKAGRLFGEFDLPESRVGV